MRVVKDPKQLVALLAEFRGTSKTIGFVPTMGYLHEGHLDLVRRARKENDICVVSIYVNPFQFGPKEDLGRYPRDLKRDSSLLKKENVDILFFPSDNAIYPQGFLTDINVGGISEVLCGAFRPGHFRGVATVVLKLLNIVAPDVMYLGQKDAQQVVVIKTMVRDLNIPVRISVIPTRREWDGLAMSSRNVNLSPSHREQASVLYKALIQARSRILGGERSSARIERAIKVLVGTTEGKIQYVACVDPNTLTPLKRIEGDVLIALAVFYGTTRLIDNAIIKVKKR